MSSKRDMRRADLVVPFVAPPQDKEGGTDITSTFSTTLPMIAMFTRNRMIGWSAVVFTLQSWLAETPEQKAKASTPGWMGVIMALSSAAVTYLPLFMPPQGPRAVASSGTEAPAAVPPA